MLSGIYRCVIIPLGQKKLMLPTCTVTLTLSSVAILHPGFLHTHDNDNMHPIAIQNTHQAANAFWKVLDSLYTGCCSIHEHMSDASQKLCS